MKKYLMYLAALLVLLVACNDDENELFDKAGFPKMSEANLDASVMVKEFFSHKGGEDAFENPDNQQWKSGHYSTTFTCFHSLSEIEESKYAEGMDKLPPIDWQTQTLVVCEVYSLVAICNECFTCAVYAYSGKYTIGITMFEGDYNLQTVDNIGVAIVLNQKNVGSEDLRLILDTQHIKLE